MEIEISTVETIMNNAKSTIRVSIAKQELEYFEHDLLKATYRVSTGKNGVGEKVDSECTPRGLHKIHSIIGLENQINAVFVHRKWTGEIYSEEYAQENPGRDWILTRILRLQGLELGKNLGEGVDSYQRCIYIHGTPDSTALGKPGSRGCIRMRNNEIIELASWVDTETLVIINET